MGLQLPAVTWRFRAAARSGRKGCALCAAPRLPLDPPLGRTQPACLPRHVLVGLCCLHISRFVLAPCSKASRPLWVGVLPLALAAHGILGLSANLHIKGLLDRVSPDTFQERGERNRGIYIVPRSCVVAEAGAQVLALHVSPCPWGC